MFSVLERKKCFENLTNYKWQKWWNSGVSHCHTSSAANCSWLLCAHGPCAAVLDSWMSGSYNIVLLSNIYVEFSTSTSTLWLVMSSSLTGCGLILQVFSFQLGSMWLVVITWILVPFGNNDCMSNRQSNIASVATSPSLSASHTELPWSSKHRRHSAWRTTHTGE